MAATAKASLNPRSVAKLLNDDATFGTVAHAIASITYGEKLYEMDVLELFAELEEDFKIELSEDVRQKLQALLLATSTDAFYEDPEAFRAIANTLLEGDPGFMFFDNLTIPEIMWAIYEVSLNHPGGEFSPAVEKLINQEIEDEGLDLEDLDDAEESPSVDALMQKLRDEFIEQLDSIGLPTTHVPKL